MHTRDPNKFWNYIKRLGPERKNVFPDECFKNGEIHTDPETMKDVWSNDFKLLYNPQTDSSFDENFKQQVLNHKDHLERRMLDPLYQSNADLNR